MTGIRWLPEHDPEDVRLCILYEFLKGNEIFNAFKNVCKAMGEDVISYVDFEFWFYRFAQGNLDIDYDRSLDPEYRSILKIPVQIIENVVDRLELNEKFRLRKVCRGFRDFIDEGEIKHEILTVKFDGKGAKLRFAGREVTYDRLDRRIKIQREYNPAAFNRERLFYTKTIEEGDWLTLPSYDITSVLMMEGLQLDLLKIDIQFPYSTMKKNNQELSESVDTMFNTLSSTLNVLKRKVRVKNLEVKADHEWHVMKLLTCLEPGFLEKIEIEYSYERKRREGLYKTPPPLVVSDIRVDNLAKLEQWKQAKVLNLIKFKVSSEDITKFIHFNNFDIGFVRIRPEQLITLKNAILASPNFESCFLTARWAFSSKHVECEDFPIPGTTNKFLTIRGDAKSIGFAVVTN